MRKTNTCLFTSEQIEEVINSNAVQELLKRQAFAINEDYAIYLLDSNAVFEVYGLSWIDDSLVENGRAKVIKSGNAEEDVVYAITLCMRDAKKIESL